MTYRYYSMWAVSTCKGLAAAGGAPVKNKLKRVETRALSDA